MEGSTFQKIWSTEFLGFWALIQIVIVLHTGVEKDPYPALASLGDLRPPPA